MITDKDWINFELWLRTYCFQAPPSRDYQLMKDAWVESAEQARKEAVCLAEKQSREWYRAVVDDYDHEAPLWAYDLAQEQKKERSSILNSPVKEGKTDAEKLAIAFDALFNIASNVKLPRAVARRALMEIKG